eukprot:403369864
MHPWRNWNEWIHVYHLVFGSSPQKDIIQLNVDILKVNMEDLRQALQIITQWLMRNVGSDQHKYLKMQKMILTSAIQLKTLSEDKQNESDLTKHDSVTKDSNHQALIFRLIQLVELGAKTNQYKKSKQGGKLAMKNVAEELGFPKFLVQMRHQAVHESSQVSLDVIELGINKILNYLLDAYWTPIWNKYRKREQQVQVLMQQMDVFKLSSQPPPFDKMDDDERKKVLSKYTKGNLKLNIPLDLSQLLLLTNHLLQSTMNQIQITFKDHKGMLKMIEEFGHSQTKHQMSNKMFDIASYVEVKMKTKNTFACFYYYLEKKYMQKVPLIMFQQITQYIIEYAKQALKESINETLVENEALKRRIVEQVKLVTVFILINQNTDFIFKKIAKQFETLKAALGKLEHFKDIDFFSWFLLHKMQDKTLKQFKLAKLGEGLVLPVQVQDKTKALQISERMEYEFKPIGQMLEQTYIKHLQETNSGQTNTNHLNHNMQNEKIEVIEIEDDMFDQRMLVKSDELLD